MKIVRNYAVTSLGDRKFLQDNQIGSTVYVFSENKFYIWKGRNTGWEDAPTSTAPVAEPKAKAKAKPDPVKTEPVKPEPAKVTPTTKAKASKQVEPPKQHQETPKLKDKAKPKAAPAPAQKEPAKVETKAKANDSKPKGNNKK